MVVRWFEETGPLLTILVLGIRRLTPGCGRPSTACVPGNFAEVDGMSMNQDTGSNIHITQL